MTVIRALLTVLAIFLHFCAAGQEANHPVRIVPFPDWANVAEVEIGEMNENQVRYGARFLLVDDQSNVLEDTVFRRRVKEIVNEGGVQNNAQISLSFDPTYQDLAIHSIEIQRGTNRFERLSPEAIRVIQQERDLERHIYNGALSAVVFLEDVRVGDRLDFSYSIRGSNPILNGLYADSFWVQWSTPVSPRRFRVLWPEGRPLQWKAHGIEAQPMIRAVDGATEYLWEFRDLPVVSSEDSVPGWHDAYGWVQFSEFRDWSHVANWACQLYSVPEDLSPELNERIETWRRSEDKPEARVAAAVQFVQDEVRYLGFEFGPNSHQPTMPSVVFARRFGDCKDKALLLSTLLNRLGIDAVPVLVHTAYRDRIADWLPSPFAFDHVVVRIQSEGRTHWIDPTRSNQRGPVSERYFPDYRVGLPVSSETTGLCGIGFGAGWPKTTVTETFRVRGQRETAQFTVHTRSEGVAADRLRGEFATTSIDELQKVYLNYYARKYPKIQMAKSLEMRDDAERNVIEVTEFYEIDEFWVLSDDERTYICEFYPQTIGGMIDHPTTRLRSLPLATVHPQHQMLRTEVLLPENWPIKGASNAVRSAASELVARRMVHGNRLTMEYEFRSLTNCVAPADVPAYIKSLDQMDDLLGYSLTWRNMDLPETIGDLNWPVISVAGLYTVLLTIGAVMVCRFPREPLAPPPIPDVPGKNLVGLSGWLFLVGLGLIATPIRILISFADYSVVYSLDQWHVFTNPAGPSYHGHWAPLLIFDMLTSLTALVFACLLLVLYFQKRRRFPKLYATFLLLNATAVFASHFWAQAIPEIAAELPPKENARQLGGALVSCLIWVPYILVSKRVKATFTR